ncbi:uncharacterized protein LOC129795285 [Lutzomyia longipalpis]|uniref:uncharacterized protein LOC129795285 n=1 Tax=Lutzomyia longipalpis TaxID=7200 RepID=UPI002483D070|nr:uncharacterized protein LOC129795285 [Lutzomyia longipalpis]
MSTERHGRRWNGHEPRSGSSEKENFVVVEKNCSKSPRPPLPDLIPIRKSTAAVVKNPKNRDGNHDGKCWTPNPMECQRQNQMVEEEKISICDKALRDEDKERRRKNGTTKGKECDEKFLENGARNDDGVGERMASSGSSRRDNNELRCGGWEVHPTEPSVNPVFLWVVQDDTEIISVRCEDYDRRNRIRLTKTSNGTWKATPRTQSDDSVEVMRRRKKKKKKERKKHRKEKKRKKKKDDGEMLGMSVLGQVGSAHELEESSRGSGGGDDDGEKLETTMVLGRGAGAAADEMDRGDCCTSEGKDGDELSLQQQQQQDDVVVQQVQEQEDYAVHGAHGNEQATQHSLGESVYETFEVDTVANCVQNSSCKDTPEEPSLLQQDQHILFASSPTTSPKYHHKGHHTHQQHPPRSPVGAEKTKEEVIEEKFLPFMCKSITEDDAQHSFKQESFADNLNVTTELIDTIREIAVTNTEDLDLTDHCEENTMTGAELLDSLIEHSCEVNNISGHIDDVKQQTPCDVEDDYNEEDELLLDSEPVANIISRLSDSPKCLSFTESGEIETILESGNIFKGTEQTLDDLSLTIKELTETKFMGSEANQKNMSELTSLLSPDSCAEEMPKDLSCKTAGSQQQQHRSPSPARPTSRGSDTIQSPQPSGLPPIPPSPDTFSQQHRLMQTLPVFPKVSTGRTGGQDGGQQQQQQPQQPEPLNLGVCRKSASPTVSCSEEAKNLLSDLTSGEENLLSSEPVRKRHKSDSYRLDEAKGGHVDKSGKDPDPLTQLRLLMSNSEWKVPNTLLVPKDRLNAVLASPAREIPLLLTTRPELRLPEAFAFPSILQDPDILVVSLNQLETILEKQEELFKVKDTPEVGHQKKQPPPQPQQTTKFPQSHHEIPERQRHAAAQAQMPAAGKFDMDPGTLNLFNQMLWLPYLQNQLRSSQNMGDFMKAPNLRNMPGTFPDLLMLLAAQNNLNTAMPPNFLGCQNPLEFALWQEAMLQESNMNIQQLQRLNAERQGATKKYTPKQNLPKMSPYQQKSTHPMHCMTNPLGNLRFPGTGGGHMGAQKAATSPFATSPTYPQQRSCGGANIPAHMKNSLSFAHPQTHAHQPAKKTQHQQMNSFPGHFPGATGYTKADYDAVNQQMQKAKEDERRHKYQAYQEARNKGAQCQSLLNLLNPQLGGVFQQQQHHEEKAKHATNAETQAVSSQAQTVTQPKLKVKSGQHLLDPAAMQRRLLTTDELSEVGSTTSMSDDGSDANSALWHPLFGSPPKSAGSGGGYVSPWQWTTVTIAGE